MRSFLLVLTLGVGCAAPSPPSVALPDLVVRNATVFDSSTGGRTPNQTLVIRDGVIREIRPSAPDDRGVQTLDVEGRLVSPGLIDTHVHLTHQFHVNRVLTETDRNRLARVYLTHGVTTVADMGQPDAWKETLVAWQNSSVPESPHFHLVAGSLCSKHAWDRSPPRHHIIVRSPEEARQKVREYAALGAKRIKLYWKLKRPELEAAFDEARELGLRAFAHMDNGISYVGEAMDVGVRHFEHFFTLYRSVADPDALTPVIAKRFPFEGTKSLDEWTLALAFYHQAIEDTPALREKFDALLDRLADEGGTLSTSINMVASAAGASPVFSVFDPKPPRTEVAVRPAFAPEAAKALALQTFMAQVKRAYEKGVPLRIGTDARNGGEVTLAEMKLLVDAGIPPAAVLQIATLNGARALGIEDRAGRLVVGGPADLVIFDKDPFKASEHFLGGVTTVKGGKVYVPKPSPAAELEAVIRGSGVEAARARWPNREGGPVHATELADVILGLLQDGRVGDARFVLELLPEFLSGEALSDYVHRNTIRDAGFKFYGAGEYDTALAVFMLATELFAEDSIMFDGLGATRAAMGDVAGAIEAFERSFELEPEGPNAKGALEQLRAPPAENR
ncbi:MAG: amidohydrolase family protein [Myxococcota bacterium]